MKTKNFAYVVGADLDKSLLTSLSKGDKVICEMNGGRVFSTFENPLVVDEPWVVVSNDSRKLILRHKERKTLELPYAKLLKLRAHDPAVFLLNDKTLTTGRVYILIQLVSHRIAIDEIHRHFPMVFDARSVLSEDRKGVIEAIVDKVGEFDYPGWNYMGVCRFALRSSIRVPIIEAFRQKDWKVISDQPDEVILRMMTEMNWMPYLLSQSAFYHTSSYAEAPYAQPSPDTTNVQE